MPPHVHYSVHSKKKSTGKRNLPTRIKCREVFQYLISSPREDERLQAGAATDLQKYMTYPYLNGVSLEFDELPDGVSGFYSKRSNTIVLSRNLFGKEPEVVLHEIQHIIQKIEGFSGGTSVEYWNRRMEEGYSKRGSHGSEMLPNELYRNTAGEIEARDTATRRKLSAEERRTNAPARADENTVFADDSEGGWMRNSNRDVDSNTNSIKEQIAENKEKLNSMNVVATAAVPTNLGNFDAVTKWALKELKKTGYTVDRVGYGRILFNEAQIKNGVKYAKTPAEKAAFAVLDKVLKRGMEIGAHGNHKQREKETITFAAPVELNGTRGNMAVVVNRKGNTYYAHRIVLPDGTEFRFLENKNATQGPKRGVTIEGSLAESTSVAFNETIPYSSTESKTKYSAREREAAEDVRTAEEYFGTTYKIAEAGYLLTDGKLLDFSGRHDGARGGYRTVDHREISDAFDGDYGDGSYSGSMVKFMQGGNIRLMPETGGINLSVKPNAQQLSTLDRYISSFRGEVMLDIDNADGRTVVSIEYPRRTYSKRVIEDINNYFDKGIIPEQPSDLGQFRYSMRDNLDAEYMEAVNTGDTETAQRLVDEAAEDALEESEVRDANGLTAVYHATYNSFTVFERKRLGQNTTGFASDNFVEATAYLGFWFNTQDLSNTVSYAGARGVKCFLNITNPYRTNTQYLAREIENDWNEELSVKENADDYVDDLKRNGYDGIILKDFEFGGTSFVTFDSDQIKSAEAITYDDNGNVIPLSERFNKSDSDIRFSMRDNAIADTPEQRREREMSYADLKRRNAELERRAEYWKAQTKETQQATVRKADTDKLARRIVQELGVTDRETISELKDELKRLGDQIVQSTGAELSYNELKERALDMADELLGNISVQLDNTNEDALIRLRGYLSSTKLRMNEREMADLPEGWRRKHRRIKLSKDGVPVDTAYMELQEMFGEGTFPAYITAQADMLQQIAESKTIFSCLSVRHIAIHSFLCYNS